MQEALNGSNNASTELGEFETAVALSDLRVQLSGEEGWEKTALQSVQSGCMSCSAYALTILDFFKLYGGGPGAPHVTFMDSNGKAFNAQMVLGDEHWKALTYTQFSDKLCFYPLSRLS